MIFDRQDGTHHCVLVCALYSTVAFGLYSRIEFKMNLVDKNVGNGAIVDVAEIIDWVPPELPNLVEFYANNRATKWEGEIEQLHFPLNSPQLTKDVEQYNFIAFHNYHKNLQRFSHLDNVTKNNPWFHFICFFHQVMFKQMYFVSHFGSRYDVLSCLEIYLRLGLKPRIIKQGTSIISMCVEEFDQFYVDSYRYLSVSLHRASKQFYLADYGKTFFPHDFLTLENVGYKGNFPPLSYYTSFNDTLESLAEKQAYLISQKDSKMDLRHFLSRYCHLDVLSLMLCCSAYMLQSFEVSQVKRM